MINNNNKTEDKTKHELEYITAGEPADQPKELEIYIHIPFCKRKCNYCDFLSFPKGTKEMHGYMMALCREVEACSVRAKGYTVRSIFFGGGTPSIVDAEDIVMIMETISGHYRVKPGAEITMEANPGTLDREKLETYHKAGINRLSLGLQSADDHLLKVLGRIHDYETFLDNYHLAREVGFDNINVDLMSGLPGQTMEIYEDTLQKVCELKPEHISSYSLILEEGTAFYDNEEICRMIPTEEADRAMYARSKEILAQYGYQRYEFSNYALPGRESIHNLGYWEGVPYLGLGLGASSYIEEKRYKNTSSMEKYMEVFSEEKTGSIHEDIEHLTIENRMEEFMFLGLRKIRGVSEEEFEKRFGRTMEEVYGEVISRYEKQGLLLRESGRLALSDAGIDVSNYILSEFLLSCE